MEFPYVVRQNLVITAASSPKWGNEEHTVINLVLTVADAVKGPVEVEFSAMASDPEEHGALLFAYAQSVLEDIAEFVPRDVSPGDLQLELNKMLEDIPLGLATQEQIEVARLLRNQIKAMTEELPEDPVVHFNRVKQAALIKNNQAYENATIAMTADYPQMEKDTWPTQDREVKAWLADPANALTPWIDTAAAIRGVPRDEYLQRTSLKTRQFEQLSAWFTGKRQCYEDQIKAATTVEAIEALVFNYKLEL